MAGGERRRRTADHLRRQSAGATHLGKHGAPRRRRQLQRSVRFHPQGMRRASNTWRTPCGAEGRRGARPRRILRLLVPGRWIETVRGTRRWTAPVGWIHTRHDVHHRRVLGIAALVSRTCDEGSRRRGHVRVGVVAGSGTGSELCLQRDRETLLQERKERASGAVAAAARGCRFASIPDAQALPFRWRTGPSRVLVLAVACVGSVPSHAWKVAWRVHVGMGRRRGTTEDTRLDVGV
mmetsp:Transcript_772/g.4795  ORF Transcript_772/g.4795 Transcript_772/m.4795 type:complete len:236 (-) Transcript_772:305-1012(-)